MKFKLSDLRPIEERLPRFHQQRTVIFGIDGHELMTFCVNTTEFQETIEAIMPYTQWRQFRGASGWIDGWLSLDGINFDTEPAPDDGARFRTGGRILMMTDYPPWWGLAVKANFIKDPVSHATQLWQDVLRLNAEAKPRTAKRTVEECLELTQAIMSVGRIEEFDIMATTEAEIDDLNLDRKFAQASVLKRIFREFEPVDRRILRRERKRPHVIVEQYDREESTPSAHQKVAQAKKIMTFYRSLVAAGLSIDVARQELSTIGLTI